MRMLVVTAQLPRPSADGRGRAYALVTRLARRHDVTLVSTIDDSVSVAAFDAMRAVCSRVVVSPRVGARGMQAAIGEATRDTTYDVALLGSARLAALRIPATDALVVDHGQDDHEGNAGQPPYLRETVIDLFAHAAAPWRPRHASRIDGRVFSSKRGRDRARVATGEVATAIVASGVDLRDYPRGDPPRGRDIVVLGRDTRLDVQAVRSFADDVFPSVLRSEPSARLLVVGPVANGLLDKERRATSLVGSGATLREQLERAAIVVAPQRDSIEPLGLLEAMATARPVVTTRSAADAIDAQSARDVIVADSAATLVSASMSLLRDSRLAARIGEGARSFVEAHYDWDRLAHDLDRFIRTFFAPRRGYRLALSRERVG